MRWVSRRVVSPSVLVMAGRRTAALRLMRTAKRRVS